MIEYDEQNNHINSKLLMISTFSNNDKHTVTKNLTSFHPTTLHSTSLNLSTLHFFPFKFHPTILHSTSLNLSALDFFPFKLLLTTLHLDIRGSFVVKYLKFSTLKNSVRALHLIITAVCSKAFWPMPLPIAHVRQIKQRKRQGNIQNLQSMTKTKLVASSAKFVLMFQSLLSVLSS
jgi:hypothetical protein